MVVRQYARVSGSLLAFAMVLGFAAAGLGQKQPPTFSGLAVCPKPGDTCGNSEKSFDAFELPFRLPKKLKPNALYKSVPFYAVVLREDADAPCDGGEYSVALERFRIGAQTRFPGKKVFADPQCPNMTAVGYEFLGENRENRMISFVAVYAGKTAAEGQAALQAARKRYPKATLHRMTASFSPIVQ